ncbi:MAG: hypothetical protein CM1200mP41_31250 [Gammaproteobacteria bacterium]|nr:MAG: hypothetical protein CM1200mP41_31250 [Gammaproteobacteria bacterium]
MCFDSAHAAEGTVTFEVLTPETALQAAKAALNSCRESGYQVAVAVVDRFGGIQVVLRDQLAAPRTVDTAVGKARTAAGFRTNTTEMVSITEEGNLKQGFGTCPVLPSLAEGCS